MHIQLPNEMTRMKNYLTLDIKLHLVAGSKLSVKKVEIMCMLFNRICMSSEPEINVGLKSIWI